MAYSQTPNGRFVDDLSGARAEQCVWQDVSNVEVIAALIGVPVDGSRSRDSTEELPLLGAQVAFGTQEATGRVEAV